METLSPDIMTIEETAQYLRIPVSSVYRLAQAGKIPAKKVGRHWRFHRATLTSWFTEHSTLNEASAGVKKIGEESIGSS